jgi:hypothetical protein
MLESLGRSKMEVINGGACGADSERATLTILDSWFMAQNAAGRKCIGE